MKAILTRWELSTRSIAAFVAGCVLLLQSFALAACPAHVQRDATAIDAGGGVTCLTHAPDRQEPARGREDCGAGCALCAMSGRFDAALAASPSDGSKTPARRTAAEPAFPAPDVLGLRAATGARPWSSRGPPSFS